VVLVHQRNSHSSVSPIGWSVAAGHFALAPKRVQPGQRLSTAASRAMVRILIAMVTG
jgi:hypothetical protein